MARGHQVHEVQGIGGLFFRSREPDALGRWDRDHLAGERSGGSASPKSPRFNE
jgi:hypothetical protein